ncbi:MAG: capsid protein [CRESS virus sp. ctYls24]|nr:MAG: capsid protein [CRESS virus sp. ctYls24]
MAFRRRGYKRRRTYPRRSYRRLRRYGKRMGRRGGKYRTTVQRAIGFSRSQIVKMRYVQQLQLNPVAGSYAYAIYSANGIYNPVVSRSAGVGFSTDHQPISYDQWQIAYNDYTVIGSKMSIVANPPNSTNPSVGSGIIAIQLSDSASPVVVPTTVMESGRAAYKQLATNTSGNSVRLRKGFSAKKFWRLQSIKDNQKSIGSGFGTNPSEQAYYWLEFFTNDSSGSTNAGPFVWVTIDYTVLLTGPADLTQS